MNYCSIKLGNRELKARLDAKSCITLEDKLGTNPLNIIMVARNEELPKVKDLLTIIWASLQKYEHGVKMEDVIEMWDEEVENGGSISKLLELSIDIFKASGLIKDEDPEADI